MKIILINIIIILILKPRNKPFGIFFFFFLQSTFHTSDPTVSWVVLVLHMTKQKPREVN